MSDLITPDEIARLRERLRVASDFRGQSMRTAAIGVLRKEAAKALPALLDQIAAQAAEIERVRAEKAEQHSLFLDASKNCADWRRKAYVLEWEIERLRAELANANNDAQYCRDTLDTALRSRESYKGLLIGAEARVAELEGLLRKHAALACGACMGTGSYLGDEDRDGPCDACGGTGHVLPEDVAAVLAGREGGR